MSERERFVFHAGFDDPARILGFTYQEWGIAVTSGMILVIFLNGLYSLLGFVVTLSVLCIIKKNSKGNKARGMIQHNIKWRYGFWRGKKALPRFPDSNVTRFDN